MGYMYRGYYYGENEQSITPNKECDCIEGCFGCAKVYEDESKLLKNQLKLIAQCNSSNIEGLSMIAVILLELQDAIEDCPHLSIKGLKLKLIEKYPGLKDSNNCVFWQEALDYLTTIKK